MKKEEILDTLKQLKPLYSKEGIEIIGLFGSYANGTNNQFSDIDIAYKLDYDKFSQLYKDGFSKVLRLDDIKDELQKNLQAKVDFVPDNNSKLFNGMIDV